MIHCDELEQITRRQLRSRIGQLGFEPQNLTHTISLLITRITHLFATAALGLVPADLMNDLKTMGFFFEAMCVRDLRVFAEALNGKVYHYRDKSGLECDAVVHLRNGQYGLIEVKLGGETLINEGIETLTSLAKQIDTTRMKAPAFKMILTATGEHAYRRPEDGIYIVPIGCLKQ